jgi:methionine-rich copper-binding protein CopC
VSGVHWRRLAPVAIAVAMVTGPVALAAPASAHDVLASTNPADRATVGATPAQVQLTFDQPAFALGSQVVVKGPSGNVAVGAVRIVNKVVSQRLAGGAPAGTYTVLWRVTSADGHPVSGQFTFTSTAASAERAETTAAPGTTTAPPSGTGSPTSSGSKAPTWLWVLVLLVLLVPVAIFVRRRPGGPHDASPGS